MEIDTLINKFQQKDIEAFQKLYELYASNLKAVIFGIVKNQEDTEELLQDVFVKAWNNIHDYSPKKGRFYTWILTISRNMAIDKLRSKRFRKNRNNMSLDFLANSVVSKENLERTTDYIGVDFFLKAISNNDKKLIELIYFQGFTYKEVSEKMNMPIGTIKTNMRKCILNLRKRVHRMENVA